jgi:hypothetical protein
MTARNRLPQRRGSLTFDVESQGLKFTATVSRYDDGSVAEIFLRNHKCDSGAGIMASDCAVVCSLALQYGVPLEVLRRALMRDSHGRASGPLGAALDKIVAEGGRWLMSAPRHHLNTVQRAVLGARLDRRDVGGQFRTNAGCPAFVMSAEQLAKLMNVDPNSEEDIAHD